VLLADERKEDRLQAEGITLYDVVYLTMNRTKAGGTTYGGFVYTPHFFSGYLFQRGETKFAGEDYNKAKAGFDRLISAEVMKQLS